MKLLVAVPVFIVSGEIGLVYLGHAAAQRFGIRPGFPEAVQQEQGRQIRKVEVARKLPGADPLRSGFVQVDADGPFPQGDLGVGHSPFRAHAEALATAAAPVGHGLAAGAFRDPAGAAAVRAVYGFGKAVHGLPPSVFFEPFFCGCVIWKHAEQFN